MAGTLALILTFTRSRPLARPCGPSASPNSFRRFPIGSSLPQEKEQLLHVSVLLAVRPANPVADFSKTQRNMLLLLGEKAGMREVVKFILRRKPFYMPPAHCIMSCCEFAKASARCLRHERGSGLLHGGGLAGRARLRRDRHHAQALEAGLFIARRGPVQVLRVPGGGRRARHLRSSGHSVSSD